MEKRNQLRLMSEMLCFGVPLCWCVDGKIWKEGIYLGIGLHSLAAEDCMKENLQVKSVLFVIMRSLKTSLSQLT
jgi:hypothetical protein